MWSKCTTKALIGNEIVEYDGCSDIECNFTKSKNFYANMGMEFIGIGYIYSINNVKQTYKNLHYFFKKQSNMKKVEINQTETIDWSKPQWVQHLYKKDIIVLTTGEEIRNDFTGTALPCEDYPNGDYASNWDKKSFRPLVGEIQFTISNAKDEE